MDPRKKSRAFHSWIAASQFHSRGNPTTHRGCKPYARPQSPAIPLGTSCPLKKGDWLRTDRANTAKNNCREVPVPLFQRAVSPLVLEKPRQIRSFDNGKLPVFRRPGAFIPVGRMTAWPCPPSACPPALVFPAFRRTAKSRVPGGQTFLSGLVGRKRQAGMPVLLIFHDFAVSLSPPSTSLTPPRCDRILDL